MYHSTPLVHLFGTAICWTLMFFATQSPGNAAVVTFDDALAGSPYVFGDVFVSEGITFEVDPFESSIGPLVGPRVNVGPTPFGVPPAVDPSAYPNNLNLDMDIVGSIGTASHVSMLFTDNGGTVNMYVNGNQIDVPLQAPDFYSFSGTAINGVNVLVTPMGPPERGRIQLFGNIDRFVFGGQETIFDEILITLPLPTSIGGDYDGDSTVGLPDLNLALFSWGIAERELPKKWVTNRPTSGAAVGLMQLNDTLFNWGSTASANLSTFAVPEPAAMAPMAVGIIGLLGLGRRK